MADPAAGCDWDWEAVRRHCYREAVRVARSPSDADDITQEALVRAWRSRSSCRSPDQPWAWVREITRNEASRMFSRRGMTHELPTEAVAERAVDSGLEDSLVERMDVERALGKLPAADRLLVRLRYAGDLTHPAVARIVGQSEVNVKVRLHRLRAKLKESLC
jgi:RNA polymerase sigma-70 factor, ECF subfamily